MKAMIFAAGLGTRLKPLTDRIPKALIEIDGTTLLEISINKMLAAGASKIVVNVHHFAGMITAFLAQDKFRKIPLYISDERDRLLDTGGGLRKAAPLLAGDEPVLIHNVDVITDLNLENFVSDHLLSGALATLAVRQRQTIRNLMFDDDLRLAGWKNTATGEERISRPDTYPKARPYAFSGIHVVSPLLLDLLGDQTVFSVIDLYLCLAGDWVIRAYDHSESLWIDTGKPDRLEEAMKKRS